jgi:hypothetical protein
MNASYLMSYLFDNTNFDHKKIQFKTPSFQSYNGQNHIFVPLRFKNRDIIIKTPKLIIPFGLDKFLNDSNAHPITFKMSFQDMDIDPKIQDFYDFLILIENYFRSDDVTIKIRDIAGNKDLVFKSNIKANLFRLKIGKNTEIYDECGAIINIDNYATYITKECHCMTLLHMSNIWVNCKTNEYSIKWIPWQIRIWPCTKPFGGVLLLGESYNQLSQSQRCDNFQNTFAPIPSPPPAPPPPAVPAPPMSLFLGKNSINLPCKTGKKYMPQSTIKIEFSLDDILKTREKLKRVQPSC